MTDRTIIEIPLELLHDSPFNPPDRAGLRIDEMAATIRSAGGILSALLVRPRTGEEVEGGYEVVFGHRRKYGALEVGLATAPCEVRALTDAEARELQAIENVQRENLKALEEATQYQGMVDGGKSANEVAAAIGKSRSHVYGRLRLLDLCPQVLEALKSGEVKGEVALLIARVGDQKMQAKALQVIRNHNDNIEDGGAKSYRRIRELLNEKFTLLLDKAIFPIASATLVPSAGSCTDCRKRTGNAPEFDDVAAEKSNAEKEHEEERLRRELEEAEQSGDDDKAAKLYDQLNELQSSGFVRMRHVGGNVCTDFDCFEDKVKAHLKAEARRLESEGTTVVTGGKARQAINARGELAEGFIPAGKVDLAKAKADVKPVTILNPRDGSTVQAYRAEDLQAAGVKVKVPKAKANPSGGTASGNWERERERQALAAQHEQAARAALFKAVRAAAHDEPRSAFDLRLVARAMVDRLPRDDRAVVLDQYVMDIDAMRTAIENMDPADLGRLLLDCAMAENVACDQWNHQHLQPEGLKLAAQHYGVDIDAARTSVQTSAAEAATAPVAKKAGKGHKATTTTKQAELI